VAGAGRSVGAAAAALAAAAAATGAEGGGSLRRQSVRVLVEKYEAPIGAAPPAGVPDEKFYSPEAESGAAALSPAEGTVRGGLEPPLPLAERSGEGLGPRASPAQPSAAPFDGSSPKLGGAYDAPITPEVAMNFMRSPSFVNSPSFSAASGSTPGLPLSPPPVQPSATPEFCAPKILQRAHSDDAERLAAAEVTLAAAAGGCAGADGHRMSSASTASFGLAGGTGAVLRDSVNGAVLLEGPAGRGGTGSGEFVAVSISADGLPFSPAKVIAGGVKGDVERGLAGTLGSSALENSGTGTAAGAGALSHSQIEPFKFPSDVKARVDALGTDLADIQKVLLWTGILLDIIGKALLMVEMARFANRDNWEWFSFIFLFLVISGSMTTMYWMAHYTWDEDRTRKDTVAIFGWTKNDVKRLIRRVGAICAIFQLGTAFAALRALRTKDHKKKAAAMDLKGMRLVDTVFLSLAMSGLQAYIGMACSSPEAKCPGRVGFDGILMVSIVASLLSATICFVALDLKDDWRKNRQHRCEMGCFIPYRFAELSARIATMSLFAAIHHGWVFLVIFAHAVIVLGAVKKYPGVNRAVILEKLTKMRTVSFMGRRLCLPVVDDVKLLLVCLAWQPSCFVSDATDPEGHFWWRARFNKQPKRRKFSSMDPSEAVLPFSLFNIVVGAETGVLLLVCYLTCPAWADGFFNITFSCVVFWLFGALSYVSVKYQALLGEGQERGDPARPAFLPCAATPALGITAAGNEGTGAAPREAGSLGRGGLHARSGGKEVAAGRAAETAEARTPFKSIGNQLSRGDGPAPPLSDGLAPVGADVRASEAAQSFRSDQLPQRSPGFLWRANPNPLHSFSEFS